METAFDPLSFWQRARSEHVLLDWKYREPAFRPLVAGAPAGIVLETVGCFTLLPLPDHPSPQSVSRTVRAPGGATSRSKKSWPPALT